MAQVLEPNDPSSQGFEVVRYYKKRDGWSIVAILFMRNRHCKCSEFPQTDGLVYDLATRLAVKPSDHGNMEGSRDAVLVA